jgi:L-alanine-DL-glutamate epimerase-like enolase superfamily enzyme
MQLSWDSFDFDIRAPILTHKGMRPKLLRQLVVRLEWKGLCGLGLAVPAPDYGTSLESLAAALERCVPFLHGRSPDQLEAILGALPAGDQASVKAAIDMALHDLLGKHAGLGVQALLGLGGLALPPTFASIGIVAPDVAVREAQSLARWSCIKLKMGSSPDLERVRAVRAVHRGLLAVDANGAWTVPQAVEVMAQLAQIGVDLVEQPVGRGDRDGLRQVREHAAIPILADEDCAGVDDVLALHGCVDGINIKLLKCGGIRNAHKMIVLARELGMKVMLGCKAESTIGVTAMAQLGGLADWLDLDGHLLLSNDPYAGLLVDDGQVRLPSGPGLGLTLRAAGSIAPHTLMEQT